MTLPVSIVVATRNRAESLRRTLRSIVAQTELPAELIVVDTSSDAATKELCEADPLRGTRTRYIKSSIAGAAAQRNQGVASATEPVIWFIDDDIIFEADCVERLWQALKSDPEIGGVNAMIMNQCYQPPGSMSRVMFTLMHGRYEKSFAGKVIGPAVNLLPADHDDLPEVVPVEWLNTTCTMYRREALPDSPFPRQFTGYSLMEDVALSVEVGKCWKLANARTARIFHDSQPADYKSDQRLLSCTELANRHFVMTMIMGKRRLRDYLKLALWELFSLASLLATKNGRAILSKGSP